MVSLRELTTSRVWVMVHPDLVRALDDLAAAVVLQAVRFRCNDGAWRRLTWQDIARDTGLTEPVIRRRLEDLTKLGLLQRQRCQGTDRAFMYRVDLEAEIAFEPSDFPSDESQDGSADLQDASDDSTDASAPGREWNRAGARMHPRRDADVPSIEEPLKEPLSLESAPQPPSVPSEVPPGGGDDDGFAEFWKSYPARNGAKAGRRDALTTWRRLSKRDRAAAVAGLPAYVARSNGFPKDAVRYLRARSWEDEAGPTLTAVPRVVDHSCSQCGFHDRAAPEHTEHHKRWYMARTGQTA